MRRHFRENKLFAAIGAKVHTIRHLRAAFGAKHKKTPFVFSIIAYLPLIFKRKWRNSHENVIRLPKFMEYRIADEKSLQKNAFVLQ